MSTTRRILIIDDNRDIHEDFRKVFGSVRPSESKLADLEADLFGDDVACSGESDAWLDVEVASAFQGEEGVRMAVEAAAEGRPYYMAFVDVRMPPGIDGVQTIQKLWRELPELPCVICTAFSDYGWEDMTRELGKSGQLLILKKPFDTVEVLQFAQALAERTELADAARQYHLQLEDQVEQLQRAEAELKRNNEQLQLARSEAEAASRAKSEFLANVSHELRTPLNGVIGMTELLLQTSLTSQQRRYSRTVRSSAATLLELLNDILDFSKVEAGKLELERTEFDPTSIIEAVTELVAHRCREKRLELTSFIAPTIPRKLIGDPNRLRQILTNLVANAVKFTEAGEIAIRATLEEENHAEATIRFSVRDTGIGIPQDRIGRLFKAFSQVDASMTRRFGGTGLGLAISRQLCELMGGRIDVNSAVGKGSEFTCEIAFPKIAGAAEGGAARGRAPQTWQDIRVLIVDDHRETREMLVEQLEGWKFTADAVPTADQAHARIAEAEASGSPYHVVLIDVDPDDEQFEQVIDSLDGFPDRTSLQVVAMVPIGMQIDEDWIRRFNVSGCVTKPLMQSELYNAVLHAARLEPGHDLAERTAKRQLGDGVIPRSRHVQARILIAEDNLINQEVAREVLTRAGFVCDVVADGGAAFEAVQSRNYDLVLMDCQMPELDGFEATRLIREAEAREVNSTPLPVLALTASALKGDRERCLEVGMSGYLSKPLDPSELIRSVDALLSQASGIEKPPTAAGDAAGATDATHAVPMIDLADLTRRCMGNRILADRLCDEFRKQLEADIEILERGIGEHCTQDVLRVAHTLKGAAASAACQRVRETAARLEDSARDGDWNSADAWLNRLRESSRQLTAARSVFQC
jgi:signal transduction histidine kinase/PleD family two-component response regulator/HPt (histidine-containing phosphotransfer) domain-containing protein